MAQPDSPNTSAAHRGFLKFTPRTEGDVLIDRIIAELMRRGIIELDLSGIERLARTGARVKVALTATSPYAQLKFEWDTPFDSLNYQVEVIAATIDQEEGFSWFELDRGATHYTIGFVGLTASASFVFRARE